MAVGGQQHELLVADVEPARHGERLQVAEPQRLGALDVLLLVELPEPPRRAAHLRLQPRCRRLADPEGPLRERQAPEQVVEVPVGGQQAGEPPAHLLEQCRQGGELLRVQGRVDHERLVAPVDDRAGRLPGHRLGDHHVRVDRENLHERPLRPRGAWRPPASS